MFHRVLAKRLCRESPRYRIQEKVKQERVAFEANCKISLRAWPVAVVDSLSGFDHQGEDVVTLYATCNLGLHHWWGESGCCCVSCYAWTAWRLRLDSR